MGAAVNIVVRLHDIDRMTLKRYVRKMRINPATVCQPNYVFTQVFSKEEEKCLAEYLLEASKLSYGFVTSKFKTVPES